MNQPYKVIRIQFTHQVSRNPVIRIGQSPFQSHHFTITFIIGVSGSPCLSCFGNQRLFYMTHLITRWKSVLHRQCIQIRLDSRTYLTASHHCHVILEICIIRSSNIRLHISGHRVHRHESCTQEVFVIANRVHRSHNRILLTCPGENRHFLRSIECFANLLFRSTRWLHYIITFGLFHGSGQQFFHPRLRQCPCIRGVLTSLFFFKEQRLQEVA